MDIASHSHQEEERHNRGAKHPNKKTKRHLNVGRSPRAPKDNHQHNHPREEDEHPRARRSPTHTKKLTPITTTKTNGDSPGPAEAPGSPEHQTTNRHNHQKKDTPGRAEATGRQKRNTNSSDQHQRTKINRSRQQEEKQNRGGRTSKTKNERHHRASRSPRAPEDKHRPQLATNTNRVEWKRESAKCNTSGIAECQEQSNFPLRKRGTVTLAPAWERGWGGARREQTLSAAPGVHPIPWSLTQPKSARPGGYVYIIYIYIQNYNFGVSPVFPFLDKPIICGICQVIKG